MEKIRLRDYVNKDITILKDRPTGITVRAQLKLDEKDKDGERYTMVFDEKFVSLNSSFFLGLFDKSIQDLGESRFNEKYRFDCSEVFKRKINTCIMTALVAGDENVF